MDNNIKNQIEKEVVLHVRENIKKLFLTNGIEGSEQIIKENYNNSPTILNLYIREYNNIVKYGV